MMQRLANVEGIAWDKDGTLYPFPEAFDLDGRETPWYDVCNAFAAQALIDHANINTSPDDVRKLRTMAGRSYHETGSPVALFSDEYGTMGMGISFNALDARYHGTLPVEPLVAPTGLVEAFNAVRWFSKHHMITHSNITYACRSIPHLGLESHFSLGGKRPNVITLGQLGLEHRKCKSAEMLRIAAERMRVPMENILFVEDTLKNIKRAKDEHPEAMTALITWGNTPNIRPTACDFMFDTPTQLLHAVLQAKADAGHVIRPDARDVSKYGGKQRPPRHAHG